MTNATRNASDWARILGLAAIYFAAGKLGLQLAFVHASATAVWLPTGIALWALLVGGYRYWPGVFLGAYLVNISTAGSPASCLGIATGNTLEALLGSFLVNRFANGCLAFERAEDFVKFTVLACLLSTTVSATFGVVSQSLGGFASWQDFGAIWFTWWLGDVAGALLVAPPMVLWTVQTRLEYRSREEADGLLPPRLTPRNLTALGLWLSALAAVGLAVFGSWGFPDGMPVAFLCLPLLIWGAFRFPPRETATAVLLLAAIALWGTRAGVGPFAGRGDHESLLLVQAFLAVLGMTAMLIAGIVSTRTRAQQELRRMHDQLERLVEQRTADLRQAEQRLQQAQKLEAIGRLAGGVAHDFNNLLTVINGYSEMALFHAPDDEPLRNDIEQIRQAGERGALLARQLLAFSRKQVLHPAVVDVNTLLEGMRSLLTRLIGADVELVFRLAAELPAVKVDAAQLEQVVMNLAVNARDAMPAGGTLTIATASVELDGQYGSAGTGADAGARVLLEVTDTGCGMDAATKERMFEPFFTTKGPDAGTGLGLATVYGIVKQSGGHIDVTTEPGRGTTFRVYLPPTRNEMTIATADEIISAQPRGAETILLAEDEEGVRTLARRRLERDGYKVLEARNGAEALRVFEEHPQAIDLLVTDVVMPRLGGGQLAERARSRRPGMKVLYVSGCTDEVLERHGVTEAGCSILPKPFTPDVLARKVRDVLDHPGGGRSSGNVPAPDPCQGRTGPTDGSAAPSPAA